MAIMKKYSIIIVVLFISSCSSIRDKLIVEGNINEARKNVITDIIAKHSKKGDFFYIIDDFHKKKDKYVFIVLINEQTSVPLEKEMNNKSNSFPSRYIEKKKRLFFWIDTTHVITDDIVFRMEQYRAMVIFPLIGKKKKTFIYLVCKNDITNYKMKKVYGILPKNFPKLKCSKE